MHRLFFGIFIFALIFFRYQSTKTQLVDGSKIRITETILSEPVRYETSQYFRLYGLKIYLPLYPEVHYGDRIVIEGLVDDDRLREIELINLKEGQGILITTRKRIINFYQSALPETHSALVAGLTLGSKATLPSSFWEALKATGTAHVVVASGMNVTLVASFLIGILILFLPRRKAIPAALAGVWAYALIAGFDAPIIRAAIMGSLAFTAQALGRLNFAWRALVISSLVMLLIKPDWISDLGFILSFVATASLMLFEKKVRNLVSFVPSVFREGLSTSLAAQIGVSPILFVTFGQFNLMSPIINALVLWTVAPVTVIGMLAGIISLIFPAIGKLILYLSFPLTSWFIAIIQIFS